MLKENIFFIFHCFFFLPYLYHYTTWKHLIIVLSHLPCQTFTSNYITKKSQDPKNVVNKHNKISTFSLKIKIYHLVNKKFNLIFYFYKKKLFSVILFYFIIFIFFPWSWIGSIGLGKFYRRREGERVKWMGNSISRRARAVMIFTHYI